VFNRPMRVINVELRTNAGFKKHRTGRPSSKQRLNLSNSAPPEVCKCAIPPVLLRSEIPF